MNPYQGLVKQLDVPEGRSVPTELGHRGLRAVAIGRDDLRDDVDGINASIELIQRTRGGGWPTGPVTDDEDYVDLVWHELEFREGYSYSYVLRDAEGAYLGCLYLYPVGRRALLTEETLRFDVDVSWWVTPAAYERGDYALVYEAVREWIGGVLPFDAPLYSNREIPGEP
jgi:hypothetical protein